MSKSTRDWFQKLSLEDRKKALKYVKEHNIIRSCDVLNRRHKTFASALLDAFLFQDTEEGFDYWHKLTFKEPPKP